MVLERTVMEMTIPGNRLQVSYDSLNLVNFAGAVPVRVEPGEKTFNISQPVSSVTARVDAV